MSMDRTIVINAEHRETRVAMLDNGRLVELHVEQKTAESAVGNVYLGKVINTVPAIQAAFVDLGLERHGFLHLGDLRLDGVEIDRNAKIGQVLNKGQKLLVQVQKDPIATKGFKLSMDVSLPGRYSVLMPLTRSTGVSRSIADPEERKRLRTIRRDAGVDDLGVIIRTVAEGKPKSEVSRDLRYLMRLWKALQEAAQNREEPGIVYREPDLVEKTLRDAYKQAETRIIVDDEVCRQRVIRFLSLYYPRHEFINEVVYHTEPVPVFKKYGLDRELQKALRRRVDLESGGFLLMEESETLTAIDVNSGKLTKTSGPEETAVRTNMEAAEEVGRQLRLRDIGGMIIVDFIQMGTKKQRNRVYNTLKKALSHDRSRTKMSYFSDLELVQITRRRVRESLERQMTEDCPYCKGEGMIFSKDTIANQVIRDLRETLLTYFPSVVKTWVNPDVYHLLMEDQKYLRELGQKTGTSIVLIPDPDRHIPDYSLRPEGIPVVLAASPEAKRLRQELLQRLQEEAAATTTSGEPLPTMTPAEALAEPAAAPEEAPEPKEPQPIIGGWGDRQLEEEVQADESFGQDEDDDEDDEDEDEEIEARAEEDEDEDEEEEKPRLAVPANGGKRPAEKRPGSRAERHDLERREREKKPQEREKKPHEREKKPQEREKKPRDIEPRPRHIEKKLRDIEPPQEIREVKAELELPAVAEPLEPLLSFRASKGPRLRFSSRRDLRPARDFSRQYELWSDPSRPPYRQTPVLAPAEGLESDEPEEAVEPVAAAEDALEAEDDAKPQGRRRKPRRRTRSAKPAPERDAGEFF